MHHLRSGARNPQPTRAPGGLNDFNYGEKYLLRAGGARPAGWGQRRPDGSPAPPPHNPRPPADGPTGWGEGKPRGRPRGLGVLSRVCGFGALISGQGNLEGQAGLQPSPGARSRWSGPGRATHPPPPSASSSLKVSPPGRPTPPLPCTHPLTGLELFCVGLPLGSGLGSPSRGFKPDTCPASFV